MKNIYLFSGLGTDARAFQKLIFPDNCECTFIEWSIPNKNDSLTDYVSRLKLQINSSKPILIGLSFGGIVAIEMAKQIEIEKIILIASVKNRSEIPYYYKLFALLKLHKLLNIQLLKKIKIINHWLFGVTQDEDRKLLDKIIEDIDSHYFDWAINKIVNWENEELIPNLIHIHGDNDKILPHKFLKNDIKVKEGGHFMCINKAQEVSEILKNIL